MTSFCKPFALLAGTVAAICFFGSVAIASAAMQHWNAFSRSAEGITGDIDLSSSRIVFQNGTVFELSYVGSVPGIIENTPENLPTQIYRIVKPQNPILLHGNALCDQSAYVAWVELPMGLIDGVNVLLLDFIKGRETPRANMDMSRKCGGVSLTREVGKH